MGRGFYISKVVGIVAVIVAFGALVTIIVLSVLYSLLKSENEVAPRSTTAPIPYPTDPWELHRLPETLSPVSYNVTLWPRLVQNQDGLYVFTGHSSVVFTCVKETDLILIHSNKLNLTTFEGHHAKLTGLNGVAAPTLKKTWLEVYTQYLVVQLNSNLEVGKSYELFTDFSGELAKDLEGFYRSEYTEDGEKKIVAATQMEPTDARKAFPCFDEPALKAIFHVTLIHPHGTVALANGMNNEPINITKDGQDVIQTSFEPTVVMSTYLLAFVVCEFRFIRTPPGADVMVRIWARRDFIENGEGAYALEKAGPILAFYERYYNSSYPMTKSDQIALPDFSAGAMENWGLITYKEKTLLYDPAMSTNTLKQNVLETISHELAHMWFGNLVTMKWWNDLWLNEGFATYVSYLGANFAEPTWKMAELFVLEQTHEVMAQDARGYSQPLSLREKELMLPYQINSRFNFVTYGKGASVLKMLSEFISEAVFSKGLSTYLNHFKYNNTVPADLWKILQMAVDSASPSLELPHSVEVIMNRWILQTGFPVVTIDTRTGHISQKRFLRDPDSALHMSSEFNYEWFVPITWMKTGTLQKRYWLLTAEDTNTHMRTSSSEWVLANINTSGFYRVNYNLENWDRLLAQLDANHQEIPVINRAQLIDDAFNLESAKIVNITLALSTTKYLNKETEYLPWKTAQKHLDPLLSMFGCSEVNGSIQAYMKKQVTALFNKLKDITVNWTKTPDHTDQYSQIIAISIGCRTGVEGCDELTLGWYREWMKNSTNNPIHPNLRSTVYCSAIAAGDVQEWDFGWSIYKNNTIASENNKLIRALSCTRNPQLLKRYLDYCLDPEKIRKEHASAAFGYIADNVNGQSLAWEFFQANWSRIIAYGSESYFFSQALMGVIKRFSSETEYKQVQQLSDKAKINGCNPVNVVFALGEIKSKMNWMARYKNQVFEWFNSSTY